MATFDLPLDELRTYRPDRGEPADFDAFWAATLAETRARPLDLVLEPVDVGLRSNETFDVTFTGFGGARIKGWLILPRQRSGPLPCVVEYIGYGGGRGLLVERLLWASAGFAHFVMDNRGQGSDGPPGATLDVARRRVSPHYPGFMTHGHPRSAAPLLPAAVQRRGAGARRRPHAAPGRPGADRRLRPQPGRRDLARGRGPRTPDLPILLTDVPFLCHFRRAATARRHGAVRRDRPVPEASTATRSTGSSGRSATSTAMNFAPRARARALFSAGLMDDVCPPSTVFAAYNHYGGPKDDPHLASSTSTRAAARSSSRPRCKLLHDAWG